MKRIAVTALVALATFARAAASAGAASPIHWWNADGDAGDSVATNDGSLVGDTTFAGGESGQAFGFDGGGDYVSVPDDTSHYFTGSFTLDALEKITLGRGRQFIVSIYECASFCRANLASSAAQIELLDTQADGFVWDSTGAGPDDGGQPIQAGPNVTDGAWHHLVVIRDVENGKLGMYVDGTEVEEDALDPGAAGALQNLDGEADPLTIGSIIEGASGTPKDFFDGQIDDVKLLDSASYRDTTLPSISAGLSGPLGTNGWYTGDVHATWKIADESVIRSTSGCDPFQVTSDTAAFARSCQATSLAGSATGAVTIKRDATSPTLTCAAANPAFAVGQAGRRVAASVSDGLSGPAATAASAPADTSSAGSKSARITGLDNAGNDASISCPYMVQPPVTTITNLNQCLRIGPFTYRFKVPLKKLRGGKQVNRRSRVSIVKFEFDGKPDGTDKKRSLIARIATSRLSNGQHVLAADILLQVPRTSERLRRHQNVRFNTCP